MSENSLYRVYNERRKEIAELTDRQSKIVQGLDLDRFFKPGSKPGEQLGELSTRLKTENLRVLVMGEFSSGKSTFINSLLGARILPDSALPTTAVITEVRYADESGKRITLFPKPGKWEGGDDAFDIGLDEFQKYTSIQHKDGSSAPSPFARAEVFWPLVFCQDRVELVDSPGLNDPDNHDEITLAYAPSADAIIYCMTSDRAYTKLDSVTINTLLSQGYTSILFVLTKFDRIQESALMKGSDEDQDFRRVMLDKLKNKTDLGQDGIFFVDALHGLVARVKRNSEALASTGIPDVERRMESYIVQQKGKAKLMKAIYAIRNSNTLASQSLDEKLALSTVSLQDLEKKYGEAAEPLKRLTTRGEMICTQVDSGLQYTLTEVKDAARLFVMSCPDKIESWVNEHKPEAEISMNPLKMKESVKNVADDYINHIKRRMVEASACWGKETLSPLILKSVQSLFLKLDHRTNEYTAELSEIRINLIFEPGSDGAAIAKQQEASTASRLGSLAYAMVTLNPFDAFAAATGAMFGWQGLLRTLTAQAVAGVVLFVAAMFTPVGWVASVIAVVIASLGGAAWNFGALSENIRKKVRAACQDTLRKPEQQDQMVHEVVASVKKELDKISEQVRAAFHEDLAKLTGEVEAAIQEKKKSAAEIQRERLRLDALRKENAAISERILDVAMEAGMSELMGRQSASAS
ncbi:MAG TPA: dynamin family protein [Bryobacteraceae bacterium]|nr:dynamin family protein [Bryobacteraceae bacterium]